jgi:hypothetical protein
MTEDKKYLIQGLESTIAKKMAELKTMQENNVKVQKQHLVKEEIFRLQRQLKRAQK